MQLKVDARTLPKAVRRSPYRSRRGGAVVIVAACAFVLALVIVAVIQISSALSSSQVTRNTVDSGVLNIAMHVPDLTATPGNYFADCVDKNGGVGLTNINRIWGKALLINANAEEMQKLGQSGMSSGSASSAFSGAESATQSLQKELSDPENFFPAHWDPKLRIPRGQVVAAASIVSPKY